MGTKIVVGLDEGGSGNRAVSHAKKLASLIGDCDLILVHVIEWSRYSFHTPQENEARHKRREEEIEAAFAHVLTPAIEALEKEGIAARGIVRHGHVARSLDSIAKEEGADLIVIGRASESGIAERIFGSSASHLVMNASVPVTVVG